MPRCLHMSFVAECEPCELVRLRARVEVLELELSKRKGVRYPDFTPDDECVQIWTDWKDDYGPSRYQWITRNRCSLVSGEYWRVFDESAPDQSVDGDPT